MPNPRAPVLAGLLSPLAACAAIPVADKALLADVPDCASAESQIAALQKIRRTGVEPPLTAVQYASPGGLVGRAIHRDFIDRNRIINGKYGAEIEQRIADIGAQCALPTKM